MTTPSLKWSLPLQSTHSFYLTNCFKILSITFASYYGAFLIISYLLVQFTHFFVKLIVSNILVVNLYVSRITNAYICLLKIFVTSNSSEWQDIHKILGHDHVQVYNTDVYFAIFVAYVFIIFSLMVHYVFRHGQYQEINRNHHCYKVYTLRVIFTAIYLIYFENLYKYRYFDPCNLKLYDERVQCVNFFVSRAVIPFVSLNTNHEVDLNHNITDYVVTLGDCIYNNV